MVKISGSINYNGFGTILTILILYWLFKIDKCPCTHIPEGKYLKEWFIFDIIFSILFFVYLITIGDLNNSFSNELLFIVIIITIINIIMIIRLLIYINKLKEIKCDCGLSKLENFIYYWYIIVFSLLLFMILLALLYYFFIDKY
jgi:hypothetical protein